MDLVNYLTASQLASEGNAATLIAAHQFGIGNGSGVLQDNNIGTITSTSIANWIRQNQMLVLIGVGVVLFFAFTKR